MCVSPEGKATCLKKCPHGARIKPKTLETAFFETSSLCTSCGRSFDSKTQLLSHIAYWHQKKETRTCHICKAEFTKLPSFKKHLTTHNPQRVRSHVCDSCGKTYFTNSGLQYHVQCTHERIERFPGPICGKAFLNKGVCSKHVKIHTGASKYSCGERGQTFTGQGNLHIHKRIHAVVKPYTVKPGYIEVARDPGRPSI